MDSSKKNADRRGSPGRRQRSAGGSSFSAMFPFGSPINASRRSILSPGALSPSKSATAMTPSSSKGSHHVIKGRVRAQDVYGGPLMFGGNASGLQNRKSSLNASGRLFNSDYTLPGQAAAAATNGSLSSSSSSRKSRLMFSASPYHSAASTRIMNHQQRKEPSSTVATASSTPSPSSCSSGGSSAVGPSADGMSSTARLILDTLDKMSTPLIDANKMIPAPLLETPSRAEKRKLIAEKLNLSTESPIGSAAKRARRRPNLGDRGRANVTETSMLKGPPVRSTAFMSPVPARPSRPQPTKSFSAPTQSKPPPPTSFSSSSPAVVTSTPFPSSTKPTMEPLMGGKIKTSSGENRAQRVIVMQPKVSQSTTSVSSLPISTLPKINFGRPKSPPKTVEQPRQKAVAPPPMPKPEPIQKEPKKEFEFSLPEKLPAPLTLAEPLNGLITFKFSEPTKVGSLRGNAIASKPASPERVVVLPDFLTSATSTNKMPVMKMPTAAQKPLMKAGSVMDILGAKGNRSKLPDVTSIGKSNPVFEGGIKPATELKNASVMSILGGMSSTTEPSWDKKFKSDQQPWH